MIVKLTIYQAVSSPSKIEGAGGEYENSTHILSKLLLSQRGHTPPVEGVSKCDKRRSSPSKIEGAGGV